MIVTRNFIPLYTEDGKPAGEKAIEDAKAKGEIVAYDKRNGIYCIAPTSEFVCYRNYIEYLNSRYNDWKNVGYLDAGMVPLCIAPSFMSDSLVSTMNEFVKQVHVKIPLYHLKPVSFLQTAYVGGTKDIWIKKSDMALLTRTSEEEASLSLLLNQIIDSINLIVGGK